MSDRDYLEYPPNESLCSWRMWGRAGRSQVRSAYSAMPGESQGNSLTCTFVYTGGSMFTYVHP